MKYHERKEAGLCVYHGCMTPPAPGMVRCEAHVAYHREHVNKFHANNPGMRKHYEVKKRYGMTGEGYHDLVRLQGGVCAICGGKCPTGRELSVDHCHETGMVRGLLCINCNRGLGNFKDDPELLNAAIAYLGRH